MEREASPEIDDELFNEVYGKAYTGPPRYANNTEEKENTTKDPVAEQSDEEDDPRDPNAVPTDFTSREAKVWEAKAKATERNWKKRKEEEMICKICGESGHFTQGCPSTLGSNRKTADVFERVPARDPNVRALFSGKVMAKIEKDVGCKLKMEEKFLIVSGKDRLILSKGVDAVHKLIQGDKGKSNSPNRARSRSPPIHKRSRSPPIHKRSRSPPIHKRSRSPPIYKRSRSPNRSPRSSNFRRSESNRYNASPRDAPRPQARSFNQERVNEDNLREDLQKLSRSSLHAYANDGANARSARSRSPLRPAFAGDSAFSSYDGRSQITGIPKPNSWEMERRGTDLRSEPKFGFPSCPLMLEEAETEFKREAMELGRLRDKEEDEENYKHREHIRDLRENYMKQLAIMRDMQTKQWEEFLQLDTQRRQQARQNAYSQTSYSDYDQPSRNAQFVGSGIGMPTDSGERYPYPNENYTSSRPRDQYADLPHQRRDDMGKAYGRY